MADTTTDKLTIEINKMISVRKSQEASYQNAIITTESNLNAVQKSIEALEAIKAFQASLLAAATE